MNDLKRIQSIDRRLHASERAMGVLREGFARIYVWQHDYSAAADALEQAVKLDPSLPDALNSLAWLRATAPETALRDGHEAVELAHRTIPIIGRHFSNVDTLAAAYAEEGDFKRALTLENAAIDTLKKEAKDPKRSAELLQKASERRELYLHQQPCREVPPHGPTS